jgi:hypothetical protein
VQSVAVATAKEITHEGNKGFFAGHLAGFVDGALGVVVGLHGKAVLVDGAVALAGDVEDLADLDVAPDFGPAGFAVAAQGIAVGVDAGLVVALGEEQLADAVAGQRALGVGFESLLIFSEPRRPDRPGPPTAGP